MSSIDPGGDQQLFFFHALSSLVEYEFWSEVSVRRKDKSGKPPKMINKDKQPQNPDMEFLDLPLELLSDILSHLVKPQHIASACRVNKLFNQFGIPKLYERASIYSWHKHAKAKVCDRSEVKHALNAHTRLCAYLTPLQTTPILRSMFLDSVSVVASPRDAI